MNFRDSSVVGSRSFFLRESKTISRWSSHRNSLRSPTTR